jgi:hypothetical protein
MDLYNNLLRERQEYENEIYDYLVPIDILRNGVNILANGGNLTISVTHHLYNFYDSATSDSDLDTSDSFWDPVVVNLSPEQINLIPETHYDDLTECIICTNDENNFKNVSCCNNKICKNCTETWFNKSVYCPFCKRDQRETVPA